MSDLLKNEERTFLLRIARESIVAAVQRERPPLIDINFCSPVLSEEGASFEGRNLIDPNRNFQAYSTPTTSIREPRGTYSEIETQY